MPTPAFQPSALLLLVLVLVACSPLQGDGGAACYPNGTCNAGFECRAGTCVVPAPTSATATGRGGAGGAGGGSTADTGSTGSGGGTAPTSSTTGTASTTSAAANAPPVILTFGTNVPSITQGEQVQLTAVVTDPDGIDDVIGGNLVDDATGATYGAFVTTAQEGAYQFTLSWDALNAVAAIDFATGATSQRTVTARFFDQAGHSVDKSTTVILTCKGTAACAGACVNLSNDAAQLRELRTELRGWALRRRQVRGVERLHRAHDLLGLLRDPRRDLLQQVHQLPLRRRVRRGAVLERDLHRGDQHGLLRHGAGRQGSHLLLCTVIATPTGGAARQGNRQVDVDSLPTAARST